MLEFRDDGVRRLAEIALRGERAHREHRRPPLHTVMERLLEDVSFDSGRDQGRVIIDAAYVDQRLADLARSEDLARYVL